MKPSRLWTKCHLVWLLPLFHIASPAFGAGDLSILDLVPAAANELMTLGLPTVATGTIPRVVALSAFDGDAADCTERGELGLVCADARGFYLDDTLFQENKEWRLQLPRTGIGFIDNNPAIVGALLGGPLVGLAVHEAENRTKIDELRRANRHAEADLAQARLERSLQQRQFEAEKKALLNTNACLASNNALKSNGISKLDDYRNNFNLCLATATDGGNLCLGTYDSSSNDLIHLLKTLGNCA